MKQENDALVRLKANIDAKLRHAVEYRRDQEEREMLERMISRGVIPQDDYSKEERKLLVKAFFASIFGQKQVSIEEATQEVESVLRGILKARGQTLFYRTLEASRVVCIAASINQTSCLTLRADYRQQVGEQVEALQLNSEVV